MYSCCSDGPWSLQLLAVKHELFDTFDKLVVHGMFRTFAVLNHRRIDGLFIIDLDKICFWAAVNEKPIESRCLELLQSLVLEVTCW